MVYSEIARSDIKTSGTCIVPGNSSKPKEIVFIDQGVDDYQILIDNLRPGIAVHRLDGQQDGILQLTGILQHYTSLEAIHIVSHGNVGYITLGNSVLSTATLKKYRQALFSWQTAFQKNTDILIYGCEVGKGKSGITFINELAKITSANISASSSLTGHVDKNADWNLSIEIGHIQSTIAFKNEIITAYKNALATQIENFNTDPSFSGGFSTSFTLNGFTYTFTGDGDGGDFSWQNNVGVGGTGGIKPDSGAGVNPTNTGTTERFTIAKSDASDFVFNSIWLWSGTQSVTVTGKLNGSTVGTITLGANNTQLQEAAFAGGATVVDVIEISSVDFDIGEPDAFDDFSYDLTLPNATPAIAFAGTNLAYTENATATQIDADATVSDSDGDADWNGGTLEVQITANSEAADQVTISDTDGDGITITVSGTNIFANGTDIGDLSASAGMVTNGTKLTITFDADATNANVQEVLQSIRYDNTSDNPGTANRIVTFTATDKNAASASDTRTIAITAVNDEPTLTATGSNPAFTEDGAAATLYSSAAVSTIESGQTVAGLLLTVTNVNDGSNERLNIDNSSVILTHGTSGTTATNSLSYSVAVAGSTATVTLSGGTLSAAAAQTLVNGISYQNNSQAPDTSNRVVTITSLTDSGGTANSGDDTVAVAIASTVTVTSVNDDPSITGLPTDITVTEDTASNVDLSAMTFTDVDAGSNSITLTLAAGAGLLTSSSGGGVTIGGSGTATLTLTGTATDIDTFLNTASNIQYTGASNAVGNNITTLTLTANDSGHTGSGGGADVALGTVNIDITEVGDTPSVTNATTNEDTQTTSGLVLSRNASDSTAVTHFKITNITGGTLFKNDGTTQIVNNDFIAFAEGNAGLKFTPSADSTANGSFDIQAGTDGVGGGLSTGSTTATITVNAVNDAPSLADLNGDAVTYFVAGAAVSLDAGANATLTDIDSTDFNGGNVTVAITANGQSAEDKLQIGTAGTISTAGSNVIHSDGGGLTIGTFSGGTGGTDLVITLNTNATSARVQDLIHAIQYDNTVASTSNTLARTITLTIDDGDGGSSTSSTQTMTVNLVRAPVIDLDTDNSSGATNGDYSGTFTEGGGAVAISDTDSAISDDGTFKALTVTLTNHPDGASESLISTFGSGAQTVNGEAVTISAYNSATGILQITIDDGSATEATTQALINSMRYNNTSDDPDTSPRSITFTATDDADNIGNVSTATLNIVATNDNPSNTGSLPVSITVIEDTESNADLSAVTLIDPDADTNAINIILSTDAGTLSATSGGGVTVTNSGTAAVTLAGTVANLNSFLDVASNIKYTTALNAAGAGVATLTVQANDGGNSGTGGGSNITLGTVSVDSTAVNDAPVITSNGGGATATISLIENNTHVTTVTASDIESNTVTFSLTGGADQSKFDIDSITGILTFKTAPSFASPTDVGGDNIYEVQITATDDGVPNQTDIQDITITITAAPPSGGGGGGSTTPPPTTTTVDGVTITTQIETDGSTTLTVPVVEVNRIEDPSTLLKTHADIPVLTSDAGDPILTASLPAGVGLSVNGQSEPLSTQNAVDDLIQRIEQETTADSDTLLAMSVHGQTFIASLTSDNIVSVQTITLTVSDDYIPGLPVIINGSDFPDNGKTALIIDAGSLPPGVIIQLNNIAFAAIVGTVSVVGGNGENVVTSDNQNQFIVLGADDDILFGGGGDDTIGSLGGDDQTHGDAGNDIVYGGAGHDSLTGGSGNDALNGGFGFDTAVQTGKQSDYQVSVNGNQVTLTHLNGETDTLADIERVQFESSPGLVIAHSEAEAAAHHLVSTWLGRDLTVAEGSAVQNWIGADSNNIVNAFLDLPEAVDFKNKTADELLAGMNNNPNIIQLDVNRHLIGNDGNNQDYPPLGLALNVDGGGGHDVLRMHDNRDDVHLEQIGTAIEITRLDDGAMLNLRNAEMIAFDSGEHVLLAHNEAEAILGRLFQTFFDRDATIDEWQLGREALSGGISPDVILDWFQTHASLSVLNDTDYIQALYSQTLDRQATETDLNQQQSRLTDGAITREWLAVDIAGSDEAISTIGSVMLIEGSA